MNAIAHRIHCPLSEAHVSHGHMHGITHRIHCPVGETHVSHGHMNAIRDQIKAIVGHMSLFAEHLNAITGHSRKVVSRIAGSAAYCNELADHLNTVGEACAVVSIATHGEPIRPFRIRAKAKSGQKVAIDVSVLKFMLPLGNGMLLVRVVRPAAAEPAAVPFEQRAEPAAARDPHARGVSAAKRVGEPVTARCRNVPTLTGDGEPSRQREAAAYI